MKTGIHTFIISVWMASLLVLISSGPVLSQTQPINIDAPKIFSQSPQSAALHSAIRLPEVGNTGAPDISIPLYTIQSGGIQVPIVLRYSTYNCKIDGTVNPNVGFGWVLDFGGSVSRSVKGKPDEMYKMYQISKHSNQWPVFNQLSSESDQILLSGLYSETPTVLYDSEYDLFSFTHPGGSGSFYLKREDPSDLSTKLNAFFSPDYNYRLKRYGGGNGTFISWMEVCDSKGTLYKFGSGLTPNDTTVEMAYNSSLNFEFPSAWQLRSIKNDVGDSVVFYYSRLGYSATPDNSNYQLSDDLGAYEYKSPAIQNYINNFSTFYQNSTMALNLFSYRSLMPVRISFSDGSVTFGLDPSTNCINKVTVRDRNNSLIREITFVTSDNNLSSLRRLLTSIVVKDAGLNTVQTYNLTYNSISFSGNLGYDYWGYFNGTITNGSGYLPNKNFTMLNYSAPSTTVSLGNNGRRTPDTTYIKHNILSAITYPSGGKSEFTFEANKYSMEREQTLPTTYTGPGLRVKSIINRDKDNAIIEKNTFQYGTGVIPIVPCSEDAMTTYTTYNAYIGPNETVPPQPDFVATNRNRTVSPVYTAYAGVAGETVTYTSVTHTYYDGSTTKGHSTTDFVIPASVSFSPNFANESEVPSTIFSGWMIKHMVTDNLWESTYRNSQTIYDQSGNPVKSISYNYATANMDTLGAMGLYKLFFYSIYTGPVYDNYKLSDYIIIDQAKSFNLLNGNTAPLPPLVYYFYLTYKGVKYPTGESVTYYHPGGSYQESKVIQYRSTEACFTVIT